MAYYEHLPIYKKALETAVYFETIVKNFSRYNKYHLGAEMRTKSSGYCKAYHQGQFQQRQAAFAL